MIKQTEIPIVFITDNNFALPTGVAITSLILNKKQETNYKIHIIVTNDVTVENKEKLIDSGNDSISVELIEFDASILEEFRKPGHHVAPCDLLKFNISGLLPQYEKIIYLDGDIIVKDDLSEFFNIDISNAYLGAISDLVVLKIFHHRKLYLSDYFNAGILLINSKKMRKDNFEELAYKIKRENPDSPFMDQDAFNIAARENIVFCHVKYNAMIFNFMLLFKDDMSEINDNYKTLYNSYEELIDDAVIIHLTNKNKPWKYKDAFYHKEWMEYFVKSKFCSTVLSLDYFYKKNYVLGDNITLIKNRSIYQYEGWSIPEDWGTWTECDHVSLVMDLNSNKDLSFCLNISTIFNNNPVDVYVNDILLDKYIFTIGENKIRIPQKLFPDNRIIIKFLFHDLKSPKDLGISDDTRKLGIGISSFSLKELGQ